MKISERGAIPAFIVMDVMKAAAERGWLDEAAVVAEILTSIARAGADLTITYHAREALRGGWLDA